MAKEINKVMELYEEDPSRSTELAGGILTKPDLCIALYDYEAAEEDELSFRANNRIEILSKDPEISGDEGWWVGRIQGERRVGLLPANYVASDNTPSNFIEPLEVSYEEIELKDIIGTGGFGKVYRGIWKDDEVAVKVARTENYEDFSKTLQSVKDEAKFFSILRHRNILNLFGVCLETPNLCLILEYARGGALSKALNVHGRKIPPSVLLNWAIQTAQGMNYLHSEAPLSIIHRDLKSGNSK